MRTIESRLREEISQLKELVCKLEKKLELVPEGYVRVAKKRKHVEYYYKDPKRDKENKNGKYIKKDEQILVKEIVQRDYDMRLWKCAVKRLKSIECFLEKYRKTDLGEIYQKTNRYRKSFVDNPILSDEEFVEEWQSKQYEGKSFVDDIQVIMTEKGERVRSKSEKIIADKLYMLGIPYRYEYPLILNGNVTMYPDFTILQMPERKEVYLEHFGRMDQEEYVDTVIFKIDTYERNGIYLGDKLFFTHETGKIPLNTRVMDKMIRVWFCQE